MTTNLLEKAAEILVDRGFTNPQLVSDLIEGRGPTHFIIEHGGDEYSVRSKEYRYKGMASFGIEQVEQAVAHDLLLVSYIDDDESFRVYHPRAILNEGRRYKRDSGKSVDRTWIETDKLVGAPLSEYIEGSAEIETPAGENATLAAFTE